MRSSTVLTLFPGQLAAATGLFLAIDGKVFYFSTGLHVGVCGDLAIRFRPALIFQSHHAYIFLEGLEATLRDF